MTTGTDPDAWRTDAACRGLPTAWWYPPQGDTSPQALVICQTCPVRQDCANHAENHAEVYGIWGGLNSRRRRSQRGRQLRSDVSNGDRAMRYLNAERRWVDARTVGARTGIHPASLHNVLGRLRDRGLIDHDPHRKLWRAKEKAS